MGKRIGRNDGFYKEALAWMGYRYAMGMTDYVGERGYSELNRYRQFMDIEFGTEEFRALVGAFCDFLKRRKIKYVIDLKERCLEQDLIWLSKNYAMGRHSYAASHWQDIVRYGCDVLTEEQRRHNAMDIRRMTTTSPAVRHAGVSDAIQPGRALQPDGSVSDIYLGKGNRLGGGIGAV